MYFMRHGSSTRSVPFRLTQVLRLVRRTEDCAGVGCICTFAGAWTEVVGSRGGRWVLLAHENLSINERVAVGRLHSKNQPTHKTLVCYRELELGCLAASWYGQVLRESGYQALTISTTSPKTLMFRS